MLPRRAQNNTVADFTTAAVEIRGSCLLSESGEMTSRETGRPFPNRRSGDGERLWFSFLEPLPLQFGDFFNQLLHLVIIMDGLANALLPSFGDTNLAQFSILAVH